MTDLRPFYVDLKPRTEGEFGELDDAIAKVREAMSICDRNGWRSAGIDLSSANEKLTEIRSEQS